MNFNLNLNFDFSGIVLAFISAILVGVGVLIMIAAVVMWVHPNSSLAKWVSLMKSMIRTGLIPLAIGVIGFILFLGNKEVLQPRHARNFRDVMDVVYLPLGLLVLILATVRIVKAVRRYKRA